MSSKHYPKFQQRATALFEYNIDRAVAAVKWLRTCENHTATQLEVEAHLGVSATQIRTVCVILGWVRVSPGRGKRRWNLTSEGTSVDL